MKLIFLVFVAACAAMGQTCQGHCAILAWQDLVNPSGTTYNAWRLTGSCPSMEPADTTGFTQVNSMPIAVTTYTDTAVTAGATYCYVVTAVNGGMESAPSLDVQAHIPADVFIPKYMASYVGKKSLGIYSVKAVSGTYLPKSRAGQYMIKTLTGDYVKNLPVGVVTQ
jgi:hypothetical protein